MVLDNIIKNDPEWNHNIEYIKIKNKNYKSMKSMNEINNLIKNLDNNDNTNIKIYDRSLLKEIKEKKLKEKEKEIEKKKKFNNYSYQKIIKKLIFI